MFSARSREGAAHDAGAPGEERERLEVVISCCAVSARDKKIGLQTSKLIDTGNHDLTPPYPTYVAAAQELNAVGVWGRKKGRETKTTPDVLRSDMGLLLCVL